MGGLALSPPSFQAAVLRTGGGNRLPPERRFSFTERAASMALSKSTLTQEFWIADSFGHNGSSVAETTSCIARYETEMALAYNSAPRLATSGFQPVQLWNGVVVDTDGAMAWDDIPAAQHSARGPNLANKRITAGQHAATTRDATHVTIFYTAYQTLGAVVDVLINGVASGTIDNRDAGLPAATFDSGRSVTFANPSTSGPLFVTLTHNGTGTTFELEGGYFHNGNSASGIAVLRGDRSGMTMASWSTSTPTAQFILNQQPEIVTICCGVNDANAGQTPTQVAASLATLVALVRAQYTGDLPAVRYVFQNDSSWAPTDWLTAYRPALRARCITDDVLFIDLNEAVGSIDGSDPYDFSNDALHPNDFGHTAIGRLVAQYTTNQTNRAVAPLALGTLNPQPITAFAGALTLKHSGEPSVSVLHVAAGVATPSGTDLGFFGFKGSYDIYGGYPTAATAAVRGRSEGLFTATSMATGLRFLTTPTASIVALVRAGIDATGLLFVGPSVAASVLTVDATGALHADAGIDTDTTLQVGSRANVGTKLVVGSTSIVPTYEVEVYGAADGRLALRPAAAQTVTSAVMATLYFQGYTDAAAYTTAGAAIAATANQNFTAAAQGTVMRFYTTPNGAAALVEVARLDAPGTLRTTALTVGGLTAAAIGCAFEVVSGGLVAIRKSTLTLANGANNNVTLPVSSAVTVTGPSAAFSLSGIASPTNGMTARIINVTGFAFTVTHEGASSTAANRITCPGGKDLVLQGNAVLDLWYDSGTSRWIVAGQTSRVLTYTTNAMGTIGGGAQNVDPTLGNHITMTLNGTPTLNATSVGPSGTPLLIEIDTGATGRTVTFGTGFDPDGTIAVALGVPAVVSFISDGTVWLETGRAPFTAPAAVTDPLTNFAIYQSLN